MKIDGIDFHVEGNGTETIVMVHGWPDTYRLWDTTVEHLKSRYRCVRFTVPGFDPSHERRARTLDELTAFIKRVVEQVSPGKPVILMLHDWGCVLGYQFYVQHPQLVSRIVGVDVGDGKSLEETFGIGMKLAIVGYQAVLAAGWVLGGAAGNGIARFMAKSLGCRLDPSAIHDGQLYPYYMTWFGGANAWRKKFRPFNPSCPMLFVYGRRKPVMFHAQPWIEALLARKGNRVEMFDTGHWVMLQQPERFNEVVGEWLTATEGVA